MTYPKEWLGVTCECFTIVELTDTKPILYINGVNGYVGETCIEFSGIDVETGESHYALNPKPLTPAAKEFLESIVVNDK